MHNNFFKIIFKMLRLDCFFLLLIFVTSACAEADLQTITEKNNNQLQAEPLDAPTALPFYVDEKILRFPRQNPSIIIIKHVSKSNKRKKPRRRLKRPKLKYNAAEYNFEEPISYYKPANNYELSEEYNGVNCEQSDYKLPHCSNYEIKSIDYDFSHSKTPNYEYQPVDNSQDYLQYELTTTTPACKHKAKYDEPRKPHRAYGVPDETEPSVDDISNEYIKPDYYVPPTTIADNPYTIYDKHTNTNDYDLLETNANNSHIDVDITYLPSYEINIPDTSDSGHFAEPPAEPPNEQHNTYTYFPTQAELPLHTQQVSEGFDYPKTSYEVPIYDPVSFHVPNENVKHENFPPNKKSTANTKHILDVPELQQAFEAEKRHQQVLPNALHLRPLREIYANAYNNHKTQPQTAPIVLNKAPFKLASTAVTSTTTSSI